MYVYIYKFTLLLSRYLKKSVVHLFPSNTCHTQSNKKILDKTKKTGENKNMRNGGPHSAAF